MHRKWCLRFYLALAKIIALLVCATRVGSAEEPSTEGIVETYLASAATHRGGTSQADLRRAAVDHLEKELRESLGNSAPENQARARRACSALRKISQAEVDGDSADIIQVLSKFSTSAFQGPADLHVLAPILCLRSELGETSGRSELRSLAFRSDTPAGVRLELLGSLGHHEDLEVLAALRAILSNPGEDTGDRVAAAMLLADAGDDREAIQYGLRLSHGETTPEDRYEGTRSADGYAILCRVASRDADTFRALLTDLATLDDLFGSRVILKFLENSGSLDDWRKSQASAAIQTYIEKVLRFELEADAGNLETAYSALRKAGVVSESAITALKSRIDERFGWSTAGELDGARDTPPAIQPRPAGPQEPAPVPASSQRSQKQNSIPGKSARPAHDSTPAGSNQTGVLLGTAALGAAVILALVLRARQR